MIKPTNRSPQPTLGVGLQFKSSRFGPAWLCSSLATRVHQFIAVLILGSVMVANAAESEEAADSESKQWETLRNQLRSDILIMNEEMASLGLTNQFDSTNFEPAVEFVCRMFVIHPAFGFGWDKVPPPSITGPDALRGVEAFVATNGWHMADEQLDRFPILAIVPCRQIRGLPWREINDREFPAFTHRGILYVPWLGFGPETVGVAYKPPTNTFPSILSRFKAIGDDWYAWAQGSGSATDEE